ncbi:MAG: NUDIX hydrolase [Pseudonocardiaceae bacterium]
MTQPAQPPTAFPVSVKGVVVRDGLVMLLRNEHAEWELPGGRIELGETPAQCVAREIAEETRWLVTVGPILDAWTYHVLPSRHVFIVAYGCYFSGGADPVLSSEHNEIGLFTEHEVPGLVMPEGYKRSIATWFNRLPCCPCSPDVQISPR